MTHSQISKKIEKLDDDDLRNKVRRGRAWLLTHSEGTVEELGKKYDPERWEKNLVMYELLVDEATSRGFYETDCWSWNVKNLKKDDLTTEEYFLRVGGDKYLQA